MFHHDEKDIHCEAFWFSETDTSELPLTRVLKAQVKITMTKPKCSRQLALEDELMSLEERVDTLKGVLPNSLET